MFSVDMNGISAGLRRNPRTCTFVNGRRIVTYFKLIFAVYMCTVYLMKRMVTVCKNQRGKET